MRVVTFTRRNGGADGGLSVGALAPDGEHVIEFGTVARAGDLLAWFDLDGAPFARARALASQPPDLALRPRSAARLRAPVPRPGKLVCIGLNYRDHAAESKMALPERPVIFSKFTSAIIGPEDPIVIPAACEKADYEAELAVVIGRRIKEASLETAATGIFGYTIVNDVSARDFQFSDGQWQRGKSCDTFAPMGPWIVTADEIVDPQQLAIALRVNGRTLQSSNTSRMVFGAAELVAYISQSITLEPGDVIATGTPSGVGFAREPPVFLQPGDVVEVEIERVGVLSNPVTRGSARPGRCP